MLTGLTKTQGRLSESRSIGQSNRLIQIDKKYALMSFETQRQVTSQLEQELDYLIGKKERELMKKRKIKELEDIYEKERANKISRINLKASRSDKNREMSLREKQMRTKRQLESVDNVRKKHQHQNQESIEKMLELQKSLTKRRTDSRSSRSTLNNHSSTNIKTVSRHAKVDSNSIDSKIERIESKIDVAKTNSRFYYSQIAEKAKSYSKNFEDIMGKIKAQEDADQSKCIREYYYRATHIFECSEKSKSFYQKQSQKKRRDIQQKFKRARNNLRELDRQRQSKLEDLQTKFDKSFTPKSWKNQKSQTYLKHFLNNQKQLEHQKIQRAETIMKKHFDLTLKNKALKEKKDKIIQTVKKVQL